MAEKYKTLSHKEFHKELAKAQKDPKFKKEIKEFIRASESVYDLKDAGLEE
jgi:hypothetical protein